MVKRLLLRFFVRISSLFGIPEIQARLDVLGRAQAESELTFRGTSSALADHVDRRLRDLGGAVTRDVQNLGRTVETLTQTFQSIAHDVQRVAHDVHTIGNDLQNVNQRLETHKQYQENRLVSLNETIVGHIDERHRQTESGRADLLFEVDERIQSLRLSLDTVRRRVESVFVPRGEIVRPEAAEANSVIDDGLYVALENYFRGSRDVVAERQSAYIPLLPPHITDRTPVVDLGCGRGEWLSVLKSQGIPSLGIDSNSVCIAECMDNGLAVELNDLLGFLRARPDASVGTYTLFQVLEHLPFPVLLEVMREMRRTLIQGGKVIAEVPNAKNLRVAAGTFWIDPTHQRPLYPEFLQFLAQEVGFVASDALYLNDDSPELDLSGLPQGARVAVERILETIDTARDFALIATA